MPKPASTDRKNRSERLPDPAARVPVPTRDPRVLAAARAADDRALRLAGTDSATAPPADIDEFRNTLARRIDILIGNRKRYWRTCKEPGCRRARACLAPRIHCSNAPPLPPDPDERRLARTLAELQRTLRAAGDAAQDAGEG